MVRCWYGYIPVVLARMRCEGVWPLRWPRTSLFSTDYLIGSIVWPMYRPVCLTVYDRVCVQTDAPARLCVLLWVCVRWGMWGAGGVLRCYLVPLRSSFLSRRWADERPRANDPGFALRADPSITVKLWQNKERKRGLPNCLCASACGGIPERLWGMRVSVRSFACSHFSRGFNLYLFLSVHNDTRQEGNTSSSSEWLRGQSRVTGRRE